MNLDQRRASSVSKQCLPARQARCRSRAQLRFAAERLEDRSLMAGLDLSVLGTYVAPGGASAEIAAYDPASQRMFYSDALTNTLGIVSIANPAAPSEVAIVDLSPYGGGPNSVAVKNGVVAVAVEAVVKTDPGSVVFFDASGSLLGQVTVGALPDMLTFTTSGQKILVANEGEPNSYNQPDSVDPEGSISIIDISGGIGSASVATADFASFNSQLAALTAAGVRIFGPNATVAQDLEPEYITISPDGATAYVTLQENNALAVVDLATATVTSIKPLGYKDHNQVVSLQTAEFPPMPSITTSNGLDASDRDVPGSSNSGIVNIRNWPVLGMYQPDTIASFEVGGQTYLLTANEGDARDYTGFAEESRVGSLSLDAASFAAQGFADVTTGATGLRHADNLGRLNVTKTLGNTDADADFEQLYAFGGRSFSIWNTAGQLVYDSGDALEQITAAAFPAFFNASNEDNSFDSRSDNKGPEPEAAMVAEIGGRTYAFIGLERIGGIVVYDVTNPLSPEFVQYVNNRDFTQPTSSIAAKDLGLEDLKFIPADDSPTGAPLVMAANEISGTVTFFAINLSSGVRVTPQGVLEIIGTPANDTIQVHQSGNLIRVHASFLSPPIVSFPRSSVQSIHAILGAGNDRAIVDSRVTLPIVLEGWSGDDFLLAGGGPSTVLGGLGNDHLMAQWAAAILVGGDGSDRLVGGAGRSVLIGGEGVDYLFGGRNQDLLIGGTTSYDMDLDALAAIRDYWNGAGSFSTRKSSLQSGVSSARGPLKLVAGVSVFDDEASDLLFGGASDDWLFLMLGDFGN